jgi:hypothetical protein
LKAGSSFYWRLFQDHDETYYHPANLETLLADVRKMNLQASSDFAVHIAPYERANPYQALLSRALTKRGARVIPPDA